MNLPACDLLIVGLTEEVADYDRRVQEITLNQDGIEVYHNEFGDPESIAVHAVSTVECNWDCDEDELLPTLPQGCELGDPHEHFYLECVHRLTTEMIPWLKQGYKVQHHYLRDNNLFVHVAKETCSYERPLIETPRSGPS